jgi:hypothetical protein
MLTLEESKGILKAMLSAASDSPEPGWKDTLGDAAYLFFKEMVESEVDRLAKERKSKKIDAESRGWLDCNCIKCTTKRFH